MKNMNEIPYIISVCFCNRVKDGIKFSDPDAAFSNIAKWLQQPGTSWIRVYRDGKKIFEWMR